MLLVPTLRNTMCTLLCLYDIREDDVFSRTLYFPPPVTGWLIVPSPSCCVPTRAAPCPHCSMPAAWWRSPKRSLLLGPWRPRHCPRCSWAQ